MGLDDRSDRALAIVAHWDPDGRLPGYAQFFIEGLARHADVVVVVNGVAGPAVREELDHLGVGMLARANVGLDVGAWQYGVRALAARIAEAPEVILTNTTVYGPIGRGGFGPLFAWARSRPDLDLWGLTDHLGGRNTPGQDPAYIVPYHLQSYWLAARGPVLTSTAWANYWHDLDIATYEDAVTRHEHAFTEYFTRLGFTAEAMYPAAGRAVGGLLLDHASETLFATDCPVVKRRAFFHEPPFLPHDSWLAVLHEMQHRGYPASLVRDDLVRLGLDPAGLDRLGLDPAGR